MQVATLVLAGLGDFAIGGIAFVVWKGATAMAKFNKGMGRMFKQ